MKRTWARFEAVMKQGIPPAHAGKTEEVLCEEKEQEKRSVLAGYQPQHTRSVLS